MGYFEFKVKHVLTSIPVIPTATLLISLVVHGVVIWMPIADSAPKTSTKPEDDVNVRVVRLPKPQASGVVKVPPKAKTSPPSRPVVQRQTPATVAQTAQTQTTKVQTAQTQTPKAQMPKAQTPKAETAKTQAPKTQDSDPTQANQASEQTGAATTTVVNPDPNPSPSKPIQPNDLLVDLSQLAGTTPCVSEDGCWTSANSQWRSVKQDVTYQIRQQGYEVSDLELEDDTGFKVSQVLKNGEVKYYLHLLSTDGGTLFVLNNKQLSRDETEAKMTAQKPAAS